MHGKVLAKNKARHVIDKARDKWEEAKGEEQVRRDAPPKCILKKILSQNPLLKFLLKM